MALFKIFKGQSSGLSGQALHDGYCYFTPDDGKFWIDAEVTENGTTTTKRICLNANKADYATQWVKSQTFQIGNAIQLVNGNSSTESYEWTLEDMGAATKSHTHGNITNDGKIGTTSGYAVYTTTNGALTAGSLATSSPTASGTAIAFIDTISQDAKGKITATKKTVRDASASQSGVVSTGAQTFAGAKTFNTKVTTTTTSGSSGEFTATRSDGPTIWFGIGSGNTNRGIYDATVSEWILYSNGVNTYITDWVSKGSATKGVYFTSSGEPAAMTYSLSATVNSGTTGYLAYYSGNNAISKTTYAHMNYTTGTTSNTGNEELVLGNSTATGAANNAYGRLALYGTGTTGSYLTAGASTGWKEHYLPGVAGYLVSSGKTTLSATGGTAQPVYLAATGVITACSANVGSTDEPVYMKAGVITTCGKKFSSYLPLSGGTMTGDIKFSGVPALHWNDGTYQQRIKITDDSTADTAVFSFQQSTDSGSNFTDLLVIKDNGKVVATTFVGALSGNVTGNVTGSSGSCTGNAATATKLATARTIITNLGSTSSASFDGSANIEPGVKGTLPVANGGTGATTAAGARANLGTIAAVYANSFYGLGYPDGTTSNWIRTTENGLIPYQSGSAGSGHSSLGTSSWYFSKAYIDNIYGYLNGNISGNAATATKATYLSNKSHSITLQDSSWGAENPWSATNMTLVWGQQGYNSSYSSDNADICLYYGNTSSSGGAGWFLDIDGGIFTLGSIKASAGFIGNVTGSSGSCTGNAASATQLQTARTIFGQSFNGTANVAGQALVYGTYTSTASSRYASSGLQIRENGLVGSAQSDVGYGPSIGFHWANRIGTSLQMDSSGVLHYYLQNGSSVGTIAANLSGNAATATKLTTSNVGSSTKPVYFSGGIPVSCGNNFITRYCNSDYSGSWSTSGTAPYNYIWLCRIGNSGEYSGLNVNLRLSSRYCLDTIISMRISTSQYAYNSSSITVYKSTNTANVYYIRTANDSSVGYDYYDFYYNCNAWNGIYIDLEEVGGTGTLQYTTKGTVMDELPTGYVTIGLQPAGNADTVDGYHLSDLDGRYVNITGDTMSGNLTAPSVYTSNWFRSTGATGWYSESYGGGWYMIDSSWIRTYGSKNIYQNSGITRTDGQFQVGDSGSKFYANSSGNGYFNNTLGIAGTNTGYNLYVNGTSYLTSTTRITGVLQAYRYPNATSLPFMTFDKPGSYAAGIGPDGTSSRIKFGPCDLAGSAWTADTTFDDNEWYFQGEITINNGTNTNYGLNIIQNGVTTNIGSANSGWTHLDTTASNGFYFADPIQINGNLTRYDYSNSGYGTIYGYNLSGNASTATNADTVDSQHFTYSNTSNSPTYLWATNSSGTSFLAARASMSVNYATSAGNADTVDSQHFTYSNTSNSPTYLWATNSSGTSFLAARASMSVNYATYCSYTNINSDTSSTIYVLGATGTGYSAIYRESSVYMSGNVLYGAAWNDYAEYRSTKEIIKAGHCVIENGDDILSLAKERMQPGAEIISDTFGFAIGKTEVCNTPIAVTGRVLAYGYEDREAFKAAIGRPVCSGPRGTVSIMTDEEYRDKGYCAIGFVSAVPEYEQWGSGNVNVDGRIWIRVR